MTQTSTRSYLETFDHGPGGWLGWMGGGGGPRRLEIIDGAAVVRSPWGVDFNHAPPGAGYLHLLYVLFTTPPEKYRRERFEPLAEVNRFIAGNFPRDFTNVKMRVRLRGELDTKGAQLLLLIQGDLGEVQPNYVCTGQPLQVTRDWSQQVIHMVPDPGQWTCLGTRGTGADNPHYGYAPVADLLRQVNVDIMLVLFPLDIAPAEAMTGDPHVLRAGKDYALDRTRLPSGYVMLDEFQLDFPCP